MRKQKNRTKEINIMSEMENISNDLVKLDRQSTLETTKHLLMKNTLGVVMMTTPFFIGHENVHENVYTSETQNEYISIVDDENTDDKELINSENQIINAHRNDIQQIERQSNTFGDYLLNITSAINKLSDIDVNKSFNGDNIFNTIAFDLVGLPSINPLNGGSSGMNGGTYDPMTSNPNEIYTSIKGVDKLIKDNNNDLSGKTIVLEIGDNTDIKTITEQIKHLKSAKSSEIVLMGVDKTKNKKQDDNIQQIAKSENVTYRAYTVGNTKQVSASATADRNKALSGQTIFTTEYGTGTKRNQLVVTEQDIQAIGRMLYTELGNPTDKIGGEDKGKVWYSMASGIIDTTLNRMILGGSIGHRNKSRAKTAIEVINEKSQFSGLWGGELNKAFKGKQGNIMALDNSVMNADIINFTREYVKRRSQDINSSVGGSTHYANPKASSALSRRMWVDKVASKGHYAGFKNKGFYHVHGSADGLANSAPKFQVVYKPSGGIHAPNPKPPLNPIISTKNVQKKMKKHQKLPHFQAKTTKKDKNMMINTNNNLSNTNEMLNMRVYDDDLLFVQFNEFLI